MKQTCLQGYWKEILFLQKEQIETFQYINILKKSCCSIHNIEYSVIGKQCKTEKWHTYSSDKVFLQDWTFAPLLLSETITNNTLNNRQINATCWIVQKLIRHSGSEDSLISDKLTATAFVIPKCWGRWTYELFSKTVLQGKSPEPLLLWVTQGQVPSNFPALM